MYLDKTCHRVQVFNRYLIKITLVAEGGNSCRAHVHKRIACVSENHVILSRYILTG